jgi:hypothetical protein
VSNTASNVLTVLGNVAVGTNFLVSNTASNVLQVTGNISATRGLYVGSNLQVSDTASNVLTVLGNVAVGTNFVVSNTASNVLQVTGNILATRGLYVGTNLQVSDTASNVLRVTGNILATRGLYVGSNLQVNETASNVLTVTGNVVVSNLTVLSGILANTIAVTNTATTSGTYYPTFVSGSGPNQTLRMDGNYLKYDPSTNILQNPAILLAKDETETTAEGGLYISSPGLHTKRLYLPTNNGSTSKSLQVEAQNNGYNNQSGRLELSCGNSGVNGSSIAYLETHDAVGDYSWLMLKNNFVNLSTGTPNDEIMITTGVALKTTADVYYCDDMYSAGSATMTLSRVTGGIFSWGTALVTPTYPSDVPVPGTMNVVYANLTSTGFTSKGLSTGSNLIASETGSNVLAVYGNVVIGTNFLVSNSASNVLRVTGNILATRGLYVGSNLQVSDTASNVLTVTGNISTTRGLFVGSNLQVNDTAANVLTVTGNISATRGLYVGSNLQVNDTASNALTVTGNIRTTQGLFVGSNLQVSDTASNVLTVTGNLRTTRGLYVGSNLQVSDTASNVLTVTGNILATNIASFSTGAISLIAPVSFTEQLTLPTTRPTATFSSPTLTCDFNSKSTGIFSGTLNGNMTAINFTNGRIGGQYVIYVTATGGTQTIGFNLTGTPSRTNYTSVISVTLNSTALLTITYDGTRYLIAGSAYN